MMNPNKGNSSLNTLVGIIDNALSQVSTAMPVTVLQVYENHTVDVMPMVDMLDNAGNAVEHAPITSIPYARLQGGDYGLIIKPKSGDKGLVVFASRDISDVVQSKGKAKPASLRKHSMSDGMYIASLLYEEPTTYLEITKDIVTVTVPTTDSDGKVQVNENTAKIQVKNDELFLSVAKSSLKSNIQVKNNKVVVAVGSDSSTSTITVSDTDLLIDSKKITLKGNVEIVGNATISKDTSITNEVAEIKNKETNTDDVTTNKKNSTGNLQISTDVTVGEGEGSISFLEHVHQVIKEGNPTGLPQK